jgi:hypothetical protein
MRGGLRLGTVWLVSFLYLIFIRNTPSCMFFLVDLLDGTF